MLTADVPDLLPRAEAVLAGGATVLQYRDKSRDRHKRLEQAGALRRLCDAHRALLVINDDVALAEAVAADGVHLGREDGALAAARARLGPRALIGASCYNDLARAKQMAAAGADYLAFGRLFPSTTKPGATPCPLSLLTEAVARFSRPVVAIGGIHAGNAEQVLATGVGWLAVSSSVFLADQPQAAAMHLQRLIETRPFSLAQDE